MRFSLTGARRLAVTAIAALGSACAAASAAAPAYGPAQPNFATAFAYTQPLPEISPPGANDWTCKPSAAHPRAVVLVHGTFENRYDNWAYDSPKLKAAGYCVFALNYGSDPSSFVGQDPAVKATGDIDTSAKELAAYVDRVLAATKTKQVDIVGHSQGGVLPRVYLKYDGGADPGDPSKNKVRRLISLGATNHGTTLSGIATLAAQLQLLGAGQVFLGKAAIQQTKTNDFSRNLNAGSETFPGIGYTVIGTRYDEVSTPYQDTFLTAGPGASVNNVTLQDGCEIDLSDHLSLTYDPRSLQLILNALDPAHPKPLPCVPTTPLFTLGTVLPPVATPTTPSAQSGAPAPSLATPVPVATTTPVKTTAVGVSAKVQVPGVATVTVQLPVLTPKH